MNFQPLTYPLFFQADNRQDERLVKWTIGPCGGWTSENRNTWSVLELGTTYNSLFFNVM